MTDLDNQYCWELQNRYIPGGSSTCSKRAQYLPEEPPVIVRGEGCRVWDADGREFIDFRCALGPVSLGYCHPVINQAIREQLEKGIVFGYPHPLEGEVAQMLVEIIPCAEKVRFLKTGGEAIAAAIKIARAVTGRNHVLQIGYNGWLNSLSPTGMVLPNQSATQSLPGIPAALSQLHHGCRWNQREDLEAVGQQFGSDLAAIVVAADYRNLEDGRTFYLWLRKFADQYGAVLIFDEIVTGFRLAIGGVQEYFQVTPDLAVFAKGLANGMPLSVYCGKAELMDVLESATVSTTYGGDALSLAAAKACIGIYRTEPVIEHFWQASRTLWSAFNLLCRKYDLPLKVENYAPFSLLTFDPDCPANFREQFFRAVCDAGVTLYNGGYVCYAHKSADLEEALQRIDSAMSKL
ncbi:MAG: aminotransferase class III-fold pyridoxal phosphate-dependent enzyme [Lentisphaerae bacterium]|nr:aminotransferase class III-fold pyridoxal phosphate-dependent enzyme [Lentisphaerota bacterium]